MEPIAVPILLLGPNASDRSGAFTADTAVRDEEAFNGLVGKAKEALKAKTAA